LPSEFVRIPEVRIAALIGKQGATKKEIEAKSKTRIEVDSDSGDVSIEGEDAVKAHKARQVVAAIGRGFAPEKALLLLKDDYYFTIMRLKEMFGKSEKSLTHKKGRVIGKDGRVREKIEGETNCHVSIFGNTVAIIGKEKEVEKAEEAVKMLLGGAEIKTVEHFLGEEEKPEEFDI